MFQSEPVDTAHYCGVPRYPAMGAVAELSRLLNSTNPEDVQAFLAAAKADAAIFYRAYKDPATQNREPKQELLPTEPQLKLLDAWFAGPQGRALFNAISDDTLTILRSSAGKGHPGHDRRHILIKDPLAALSHALEDDIRGAHSIFIIAALLHDVGRLPEPLIDFPPPAGVSGSNHAHFSYFAAKKLLTPHFLPYLNSSELGIALRALLNETLMAVMDHRQGDSRSSFIAQAAQRSDREQLVGPEGILRTIAFDVGYHGLCFETPIKRSLSCDLPLPGSAEDRYVGHHIEFYMRNLYPNIGCRAAESAERLKVISGTFLWLMADDQQRRQFFTPELQPHSGFEFTDRKPKLAQPTLCEIVSRPPAELSRKIEALAAGNTIQALAESLISAPHAKVDDIVRGNVTAALSGIDIAAAARLKKALSYALIKREELDKCGDAVLSETMSRYATSPHLPQYKLARALAELRLER